jgi:hypothetical protein
MESVSQPVQEDIRFSQARPQSRYSIEIQKSGYKLILNRDDKPFRIYNIAVGNQGSDKLEKADLITLWAAFTWSASRTPQSVNPNGDGPTVPGLSVC